MCLHTLYKKHDACSSQKKQSSFFQPAIQCKQLNTEAGVEEVTNSGGNKLDNDTRFFMESRLGHDFGNVQLHTDRSAANSASAMNALAYTHGQHIIFGQGQYEPQTKEGKQLLAHELVHTIQQGNGASSSQHGIQRQPADQEEEPGVIGKFFRGIGKGIKSIGKFFRCHRGSSTSSPVRDPMTDISTFQSPGASGWFGAKFGCFRNTCSRMHSGWDIHAPVGTPVVAVVSGQASRHTNPGGFGDFMDLTSDADNNMVYRYAHLSSREANGHYCPGDKIGETGITGNASANRPHLHLQVVNGGTAVDPIGFFTEPTMVIEQTGTAAVLIDKTIAAACNPC